MLYPMHMMQAASTINLHASCILGAGFWHNEQTWMSRTTETMLGCCTNEQDNRDNARTETMFGCCTNEQDNRDDARMLY